MRTPRYEYVKTRLFGDRVGSKLYEKASEDFEEVFRDSVDEVAYRWLEKYKERFDRERDARRSL